MEIDAVLSRIEDDVQKYLVPRPDASLIVGLVVDAKRHIRSFRSPGTELVPLPDASSVYEIGSFSKVYTSSVLAVLVGQGAISLDDTIDTYLPFLDLKPEIAQITIRQLATHSSGLNRCATIFMKMVEEDTRTCYLRYRKEDLYEELESTELVFPSSEGWEYSIIGMGLLGHIIELATGKSYEENLREHICAPLGLPDTCYTNSDDQLVRMMRGVDRDGSTTPNWYHDVLMPQGGLRSTMADMLSFAEANLAARQADDGSALHAALRLTREPHFQIPDTFVIPEQIRPRDKIQMGLAWWGVDAPNGPAWEHGGVTQYYQSSTWVSDVAPIALVALTSYYGTLPDVYSEIFGTVEPSQTFAGLTREWFMQVCS